MAAAGVLFAVRFGAADTCGRGGLCGERLPDPPGQPLHRRDARAALPFVAPAGWTLRTRAGAGRRVAGLALAAAVAGGVSLLLLWPYLRTGRTSPRTPARPTPGEEAWAASSLMDPLTSSPEWPFGPPTAWGGVFPGFGFGLLVSVVALLALVDAVRFPTPGDRGGALGRAVGPRPPAGRLRGTVAGRRGGGPPTPPVRRRRRSCGERSSVGACAWSDGRTSRRATRAG